MNITDRQKRVLKAVVSSYIEKGKAIGSDALVKKHGILASPATVRYELTFLAHQGLIKKKHRSAGRIPTPTGLRYYLSEMFEEKVVDYMIELDVKKRLSNVKFEREPMLREAVSVLAEQSKYLGFCVMPDGPRVGGISNLLVMEKRALESIFTLLEDDNSFTKILENENKVSTKVLLGSEIGTLRFRDVGIAYKDVRLYGEHGWLGVLGPIWMDYRMIFPLLTTVIEIAETEAAHWGNQSASTN